ncbi:hypothetical protein [Gemelliphila palaticanis]|uniref:Uncharacterized protein n=1 Tax=Gemelliphila palaticanis TaxID=81950 RepID=A0ABX2SZ80_9BACL|nr:hypothetical protein [Gemella palaticanis]MBF0715718.1 hypothetical protein [Gemella palaticanis]NYS47648.1 hypothetical protein [Gemella palaticanis]
MKKSKFEEKIQKEILHLNKKEDLKNDEIKKLKDKLKKLESELTKISKQKIAKENELLTLEITKQHLTMQDVLRIIKNKDIVSIYKEQERTKEEIGDNNVE